MLNPNCHAQVAAKIALKIFINGYRKELAVLQLDHLPQKKKITSNRTIFPGTNVMTAGRAS